MGYLSCTKIGKHENGEELDGKWNQLVRRKKINAEFLTKYSINNFKGHLARLVLTRSL